jgi:hypothetical protein
VSDLRADIVLARIGGATHRAIAMLHDIHIGTVRRECKRAYESGLATLDVIGATARFGKAAVPALPEAEYQRKWVARVRARCVESGSGCLLWCGFVGAKGYGHTNYRGSTRAVHRKMFEIIHGLTLKTEQFVCHRCDVPNCCNPDHLFLGNNDENMADKCRKGRHHEMKVTACPRGHEYNAANTRINPSGSRACRLCSRARQRLKSGWPVELAYSAEAVPSGYTREVLCR